MHSNYQHSSNSIRFRRWSRAGYAVFCSLGNDVTIGRLDVATSDKSLQKTISTSGNSLSISYNDVDADENSLDKSELEVALFEKMEVLLTDISFECTVACAYYSSNYIIHHSG